MTTRVRDSRFWEALLERYPRSPSVALCRVPEVELLAQLQLVEPVLDHCCGDGYIASLCFPGVRLAAGVDIDHHAVAAARRRNNYLEVLQADVSRSIPLPPRSVGLAFNNSGLEHIADLDGALAELARVLRPGATFHFNVLNRRYFDWWPLSAATRDDYRRYQPFHHALDELAWTRALERNGFRDVRFCDYLPRATAEVVADYDYRYSSFYMQRRLAATVALTVVAPPPLLRALWRRTFGDLEWRADPGRGAGFLVSATRDA